MEEDKKKKQKKLPYRFTCEIPTRVVGKMTEEEKAAAKKRVEDFEKEMERKYGKNWLYAKWTDED